MRARAEPSAGITCRVSFPRAFVIAYEADEAAATAIGNPSIVATMVSVSSSSRSESRLLSPGAAESSTHPSCVAATSVVVRAIRSGT